MIDEVSRSNFCEQHLLRTGGPGEAALLSDVTTEWLEGTSVAAGYLFRRDFVVQRIRKKLVKFAVGIASATL